MNRSCCYIKKDSGVACSNVAEWAIIHGPTVDDYTEACTEHVGDLLTDAPEHRIYPIREDE
jgi:hypothetical protein